MLSAVSLKTKILKLPEEFVEYLNQDGIILPDDSTDSQSHNNFTELKHQIENAINELDGYIFPKLNWSSPKDAAWIALDGTLKCDNMNEIILLLKSSDFINHDLYHAYEKCIDRKTKTRPSTIALALRKWYTLFPSMEFRCFIRNSKIIAICQRDVRNFYDFLADAKLELLSLIVDFFTSKINPIFQEECYVIDVYINKSNKKVWLMDINPFCETTDSLLFNWNDLLQMDLPECAFEIIESHMHAQSSSLPIYSSNRLPKDVIDLSNGFSIEEFSEQFQKQLQS